MKESKSSQNVSKSLRDELAVVLERCESIHSRTTVANYQTEARMLLKFLPRPDSEMRPCDLTPESIIAALKSRGKNLPPESASLRQVSWIWRQLLRRLPGIQAESIAAARVRRTDYRCGGSTSQLENPS